MPRSEAGVYSLPSGSTAPWAGNTITSSKFNEITSDLVSDANAARPVVAGGTGGTTPSTAREALGLVIGTDVQGYDADLAAIAALGYTSGAYLLKKTAAATYSLITLSSAGEALLDDTDAAAQRTTLGLGSVSVMDAATAAQFRANTADKALVTDDVWSAASEVTLTDAATIAVDMSTFLNAIVTLGGNRTLGQPSNTKAGQSGCIRIVQDGTGSRTLAYHSDWKFAGGSDPVLSTVAGTTDLLFYQVIAANFIYATLVKAVA